MLASHNSWTFAKPKKWWMRLIAFTARCQKLNIQEQYKLGVRFFDLRLRDDKVCHGLIEYGINYFEDLFWLNGKGDVHIRILFESYKPNCGNDYQFISTVRILENVYPDIKFYGGNRKYDWEKIYDLPDPELIDKYSSTTTLFPKLKSKFWKICDDWWPWLYSYITRKDRKKWEEEYKDKWLMLDFIGM